jgi:hypothetical protein
MDIQHAPSDALTRHRVHAGALWFAVLCGPLAALANEQIEYALVAWSCGRFDPISRVMLHVVPIALVLLCALAGLVAWRARPEPIDASDNHNTDADRSRRGFMVMVGLGLSALGIIVIIAQWIPVFYLNPCTFL